MTSSIHAILSDLHRMLSVYDEQDFLAAARHRGTHATLREALTALAKEARLAGSNKGLERDPVQKKTNAPRAGSSQPAVKKLRGLPLEELLMRSSLSSSSAQMVDLSRRHGVSILPRPKEGRE